MYQVTHISSGRFGMNFQIESATESGSATHFVYIFYTCGQEDNITLHKITALVINYSIVTSSEVQEQVEVGDEVPMRSSPSRNVQPENIHRNGKSLNY